ncbi:MAG TPA: hypothetical protein VF898_14030 [Chloroflexota bacterium]
MNTDALPDAKAAQMAGITLIATVISALTALVVLFIIGARRGRSARKLQQADARAARVPIQPAVNTTSASTMPPHFTEDLLVPGRTFTGPEILRQDERQGRSDEGV